MRVQNRENLKSWQQQKFEVFWSKKCKGNQVFLKSTFLLTPKPPECFFEKVVYCYAFSLSTLTRAHFGWKKYFNHCSSWQNWFTLLNCAYARSKSWKLKISKLYFSPIYLFIINKIAIIIKSYKVLCTLNTPWSTTNVIIINVGWFWI